MRIYFILAVLALTMTATVAVRVVFSLFALELGAGAFQVGLLSAANQLPALLLAIPVGVMGDRFGARWPMFVGALFGVVGVLLPYLFPSAPALFVGAALCGVWAVLILVLSQVVVGMLSPPQEMTRNYSRFAMAMSLTALAGPVIAGHAIEQLGHALACLVLVAFPVVIAALLLAWGGMLPPGERGHASPGKMSDTLSDRAFWRVMWINVVVQLAIDLYPFYMPVYGHAIGLSASTIGWILASASLAAFGVRFALAPLVARFGEERLLAYSLGLAAISLALTPLATTPALLMGVALFYGMGVAGGAPITAMLMFKRSSKGRAGESMGLRMTGNAGVRVVAPTLFGALAAATGLLSVFLAAGLIIGGAAWAIGRSGAGPGREPREGI